MNYTAWELIEAFEETNKYNKYDNLLDTKVYKEEDLDKIKLLPAFKARECMTYYTDTVTAILESKGYVAALNFADGYRPGGLVLDGSRKQEESLCRSSNLYKSLSTDYCYDSYYRYNKKNIEFCSGKSSDRIIYTKNVVFFRDKDLNWLDEYQYKFCDIITCAAPMCYTASDEEIKNRMRNIIKVAEDNRVGTLILGCWGCGSFGNDWEHFAKLWREIIETTDRQCNIVMATQDKEFMSDEYKRLLNNN